ncbi:hypothetical protein L484_020453 [Morus notabilis]|uniref:Uncharacterized protein n=1 Tax=Morus notabilis TaxID=981085 RepID=W9SJD4_9ROSA|nr:hypothetical protein L484_020453 [Morus notabilis]
MSPLSPQPALLTALKRSHRPLTVRYLPTFLSWLLYSVSWCGASVRLGGGKQRDNQGVGNKSKSGGLCTGSCKLGFWEGDSAVVVVHYLIW